MKKVPLIVKVCFAGAILIAYTAFISSIVISRVVQTMEVTRHEDHIVVVIGGNEYIYEQE